MIDLVNSDDDPMDLCIEDGDGFPFQDLIADAQQEILSRCTPLARALLAFTSKVFLLSSPFSPLLLVTRKTSANIGGMCGALKLSF